MSKDTSPKISFTPIAFDKHWFVKAGSNYMVRCTDIDSLLAKYSGLECRAKIGNICTIGIPSDFKDDLLEQLKKEESLQFEQSRNVFALAKQ